MSAIERNPVPVDRVGNFNDDIVRLYEALRVRANGYFAERGSMNGYEADDWMRAERDMVLKPEYKLSRANQDLIVEMTLPDAEISGLAIRITPNEMLISSRPDNQDRRIFRIIRFTQTIDSASVDAEVVGKELRVVTEVAQSGDNLTHSRTA